MRLIDADALSEKLCKTTIFIKDGEVFQRMINDAPTESAEAVQGCDGCRYDTQIPQEQCLRCGRYWRDSYARKGGDPE